jgi:manganese oxidase
MRAIRTILIIGMVLGLMAFSPASQQQVVQAAGSSIVYNLYATDGWNVLADGTVAYMYGFVGGRQGSNYPLTFQTTSKTGIRANVTLPGGSPAPTGGPVTGDEKKLQGNAQFPAPLIYAQVGDVVTINLKNLGVKNDGAPNDPHSIHLHGLDVDAANDGVPETSVGAIPANLPGTPGAGNVVVYMFAATRPGSYMYHCHQEADIHVQMGMYGALIIYERGSEGVTRGPGHSGTLWGWHYDKDVVLLLSEEDLGQHVSEQFGNVTPPPDGYVPFNPVDYHPQYWFINGLSFPNTIHVGGKGFSWTDWIAAHPGYDPFITGSVSKGDKVLIRMINMGFETQPMHMHGFHGKVIGSDQRPWVWGNTPDQTPTGQGLEKNTITIGSGETYEWLIDFKTQNLTATYQTGTQTRYNDSGKPVSNTKITDPVIPDLATNPGTPYIGGPVVTGAQGLPLASQLFPFHNHDDYKATNNGDYPGGMFTMIMPTP